MIEKIRQLLEKKLDQTRKELWEEFKDERHGEYEHQIATEKAWEKYLSSIGCRAFSHHELRRNFETTVNELGSDMVCVEMPGGMEFVFVPKELATKVLVLDSLP
jgi:hypothetical protein